MAHNPIRLCAIVVKPVGNELLVLMVGRFVMDFVEMHQPLHIPFEELAIFCVFGRIVWIIVLIDIVFMSHHLQL